MFKFVNKKTIESKHTTRKSFEDSLLIWIKKPHVVNRKLCGSQNIASKTIFSKEYIDLDSLNSILRNYLNLDDINFINDNLKNYIQLNRDCESFECFVRLLIPKLTQYTLNNSLVELIIYDRLKLLSIFIPISFLSQNYEEIHHKYDVKLEDYVYQIYFDEIDKKLNFQTTDSYPNISSIKSIYNNELKSLHSSCLCSLEWLCNILLFKISRWSKEDNLDVEQNSLKCINIQKYNEKYSLLKDKYGKYFVEIWPESTNPEKFVFEDVGIATYFLIWWEEERKNNGLIKLQSFVDLGCGNGLLVYILSAEGHPGYGIDIRKRKIWDLLATKADLREQTIIPTQCPTFSDCDWLIGNHSDELSPWIPVMAARSHENCQFFLIPCCPWDFTQKFSLINHSYTRMKTNDLTKPNLKLNHLINCVNDNSEKMLSITSNQDATLNNDESKNISNDSSTYNSNTNINDKCVSNKYIITDYNINTSNKKTDTEFDISNSIPNKTKKIKPKSRYEAYLDFIKDVAEISGFKVSRDVLRIPSTRRVCYIGSKSLEEKKNLEREHRLSHIKSYIEDRCNILKQSNNNISPLDELREFHNIKKVINTSNIISDNINDSGIKNEFLKMDNLKFDTVSFKPRDSKEKIQNAVRVNKSLLEIFLINTMQKLLEDVNNVILPNGKLWNKGGSIMLIDIIKLFNQEELNQLKNECGGLQTVLRNCPDVFSVQQGMVTLRDWNSTEFTIYRKSREKIYSKRNNNSQLNIKNVKLKTKICFFFKHHPDKCPLDDLNCRYLH